MRPRCSSCIRGCRVSIVGSDLAHAVPLTPMAGLGHAQLGTVDFVLVGSLLLGSLPGIYVGTHRGVRLPDQVVRPIPQHSAVRRHPLRAVAYGPTIPGQYIGLGREPADLRPDRKVEVNVMSRTGRFDTGRYGVGPARNPSPPLPSNGVGSR
jgi:hypothetical protein